MKKGYFNPPPEIMTIQALPGHVLILPIDETETIEGTQGSFKIADSVKDAESQRVGRVLSIGDEITTVYGAKLVCPMDVKVGSLVIHGQVAYDRFQYKNYSIKLIPFNDLKAIIKE